MPDLRIRAEIPELMDTAPVPLSAMRRALGFLTITNRWCGGTDLVLRHLRAFSSRWPVGLDAISVLDVGTGMADIPLAMVRWAQGRGVRLSITGLELVTSIAGLARERLGEHPQISIVEGNLFELTNGPMRYDYVTASLFLHHVEPAHTVEALRSLGGLALRGLIISDLQRTWPSYVAVSAAGWLLGNRIVRHDAPASVRRAFRRSELDALAREAGMDFLAAHEEPWFRISLAGERPDAW